MNKNEAKKDWLRNEKQNNPASSPSRRSVQSAAFDAGFDAGQAANDWVPVSERLPKLGGSYIVTIDWGDMGNDDPYGFVADYDHNDQIWSFTGGQPMSSDIKVLAWIENFPLKYQDSEGASND